MDGGVKGFAQEDRFRDVREERTVDRTFQFGSQSKIAMWKVRPKATHIKRFGF